MSGSTIRADLIKARDNYIREIRNELLGPGSEFSIPDAEHELISSSPMSRYSVGILFPKGNLTEQDNDETVSIDDTEEAIIPEDIENGADSEKIKPSNKFEKYYELDETASENLDEEIGMATQYKPSSMGLTFLVKGKVDKVKCHVSFATYRKAILSDCMVPYEPTNMNTYEVPSEVAHFMIYDKDLNVLRLTSGIDLKELRRVFEQDTIPEDEFSALRNCAYRLAEFLRAGYVREPHVISCVEIEFGESDYYSGDKTSNLDGTTGKIVALKTKISDELYSITIMFLNDLEVFPAKATECLYQPVIRIESCENTFLFSANNALADPDEMDNEEKSLELLYRNKNSYGTGLGVSVNWEIDNSGAGSLWSEFFPEREIPPMSFSLPENDSIKDNELSMKYLSDLSDSSDSQKILSLTKLVDLYSSWIESLKMESKTLDCRYETAAVQNIEDCITAASRMYEGIRILKNDKNAFTAFMLANRAMFMQRIHLQKQAEMARKNVDRYPGDEEISEWLYDLNYQTESDENARWRPFQIAFLLMDIKSITDEQSKDRELVDLIWFPTGGGKTEAYLGLTAFTIFFRRLTHPEEAGGTTVMMRYTLRLLAAQQFTRAATLICACEYIRQDSLQKKHKYPAYPLGKEPITIGLWIGGTHIPNNIKGNNSAEYHLDKLYKVNSPATVKYEKERHNKFQVLKCPWCGTKMVRDAQNRKLVGSWGYVMNGSHFSMFCPHEDCTFTNKLPIQIIDEELYLAPPTLLFGTVDKFAMMAWDGRTSAFFGSNSNNRGPELIIQDELHLISGALGTMVGLYETAIDALSGMKGTKPKIIASTATIRRAKEQCAALYNREVVQFPAPGLNSEDSFFAREDTIDYSKGKYGRKYVGVMPSGRTKAMTEIRLMAALLQKVYMMKLPDQVKDKLWTLTVYFNSLKDLGKASTLVDDDVKDFIIRTANRMFTSRRLIISADELTSRVTTTELNETLDKLERVEYSKANIEAKKYASNVLLATNMISVGIDVARLNAMLMIGQPKLTSEYIQASSRVGRSYPGVVFVQYDATKSRDRSHYEQFRPYHDSFYRFVEPTGATPFSKPARERALHAVFVTMMRNKEALFKDNSAAYFDRAVFSQDIAEIESYILDRARGISNRTQSDLQDDFGDIQYELEEFVDFWQDIVTRSQDEGSLLYFGRKHMVVPPAKGEYRLLKQYHSLGKDDAVETLTSMRNVDSSVIGDVIIWED